MIVYNYDKEGLFTGPSVPPINPMAPEEFLKPMDCTEVQPPEGYPVEQIPKWNGSAWSLVDSPYKLAQDEELARQEEENQMQADEAARELNVQKLQEKDANGFYTHYEDENGDAVAKTQEELDNELANKLSTIAEQGLLAALKTNIVNKGIEMTGGIDSESIAAFFQAYQLRAANPASYVGDGFLAKYAVDGFAIGDALDTEAKITGYYNLVMIEMDKFREAEYAAYATALAAL